MTDKIAEQSKKPKKPRNKWTLIFVRVMEYLLRDYNVEIIPEFELYKEPMRIDIVVIKFLENVVIENTVMKFFRKHNIVEFKGPTDSLTINSFDRVLSYFYAYLSQKSLDIDDVAITFVSVKYPKKLLEVLQNKRNYKIIPAQERGIYYIMTNEGACGYIPPIQLVVNSELSAEDAELIEKIRNDWTVEEGAEMLKRFDNITRNNPLAEIINLLCSANNDIFEEDESMTTRPLTKKRAREILFSWSEKSGVLEEARQQAAQQAAQQATRQGMQQGMQQLFVYLSQGHSLEEAKKKFAFA